MRQYGLGRLGLSLLAPYLLTATSAAVAQSADELVWGGDAEGGAPFVSADPDDTSRVVGFEVDVAELMARGLGRRARFVQSGFTTLDAAVSRGDFDIALSGLEDLPGRRSRLAVTIPYYEFEEKLTVRGADRERFRSLADLAGRRVATLGATLAAELLEQAERDHGVVPVLYEDDVHPYSDLALGRVDAVVLDQVLADKAMRRETGLVTQPGALAVGHYVGVLAPDDTELRDRIDAILRAAMGDGTLERIFRSYGMWNEATARLYERASRAGSAGLAAGTSGADGAVGADETETPVEAGSSRPSGRPGTIESTKRYLPRLLQAAAITITLSCLAMALAVALGIVIASGRVYGPRSLRMLLTGIVEVIRGTPLLLQLFVIYFGLASVIRLPAFIAALLGLGLNYAAYESEIYRGALEAVPKGQLDAARTLGLTDRQILRFVRGPQAFRLALAPMTNDFIALLKDSSLVSVITVVELTKQASIFASDIGSWVVPGLLCAVMYLAMSLPLARLARRIETGWRRG
ncbi:MAG: ABC transporter permease subunit [Acidimicrobiia bacterium]|nr:ABC transporter permease subunit [Acidimicrobiia bacterium]